MNTTTREARRAALMAIEPVFPVDLAVREAAIEAILDIEAPFHDACDLVRAAFPDRSILKIYATQQSNDLYAIYASKGDTMYKVSGRRGLESLEAAVEAAIEALRKQDR